MSVRSNLLIHVSSHDVEITVVIVNIVSDFIKANICVQVFWIYVKPYSLCL